MRFLANKTGLSPPVIFLFYLCLCVGGFIYCVCFVIILVPHLSFFCCLGKAVIRDSGICFVTKLFFYQYFGYINFIDLLLQNKM